MKGLELSERFYRELVRPLLSGIPHAAARLGSGSDMLGLDDEVSRDHDWGCRLTLLLEPGRLQEVDVLLEQELPEEFLGHPVRFVTSWDQQTRHRAEISTVHDFVLSRLGHIPQTPVEWLLLPGQALLEVTAGPVFQDDSGDLTRLRQNLAWYPHDLWLYVLACGWTRMSQELPLLHRTLQRGDQMGSEILRARLQRDLMYLAFFVERRWPAYPKWAASWLCQSEFGRHFVTLKQEDALLAVHEKLRALGLVSAPATQHFYDRGILTVNWEVVEQLYAQIQDPVVAALPRGLGAIEQWSDNVDLLCNRSIRRRAAALYGIAEPSRD